MGRVSRAERRQLRWTAGTSSQNTKNEVGMNSAAFHAWTAGLAHLGDFIWRGLMLW